MSLKGKFSPPYTVDVLGEKTLVFKRMLTQEWEELSERVKADLIESESRRINVEMKDYPAHERAIVRTRMRDHFEQEVTMSRVIRDSSTTAKGIRKLLAYALANQEDVEWVEILSPTDINVIIEQIVYMPVVKPPDPSKLPPPNEASSGGSATGIENPIGDATPPTSNPPSSDTTPAS